MDEDLVYFLQRQEDVACLMLSGMEYMIHSEENAKGSRRAETFSQLNTPKNRDRQNEKCNMLVAVPRSTIAETGSERNQNFVVYNLPHKPSECLFLISCAIYLAKNKIGNNLECLWRVAACVDDILESSTAHFGSVTLLFPRRKLGADINQ